MIRLKNDDIILFQGDSITDGNRGRNTDPNHILGHGYQFILSAKIGADNLDKNITCINRGISGNSVKDLYDRWEEDCIKLNPDILSILIGVNDAFYAWNNGKKIDYEKFEETYKSLIDMAKDSNPDMQIVLLEPFFEKLEENEYNQFMNETVRNIAKKVKGLAEEYNTQFVPLQDMFDSYCDKTDISRLIWDGVHPTYTGHELIARRWLDICKIK